MKLIVAILVALGLGWLIDTFRRKSVSAPGIESGTTQSATKPLSAQIADTADAAMGAVAGAGMKAADTAQRAAPGAASAVSTSMDKMSGAAGVVANKASDAAATATGKASDVAAKAADTLSGAAATAADKAPESVTAAASKAAATAASAAEAVSGAASAAASRLPGGGGGASSSNAGGASAAAAAGGGMQGSASAPGQTQTSGGSQRAGAGDLTSAQEAFDEALPATPPAGVRPMEGPLRPDEADVRSALVEPTPEAVEVYDEERDAIMLRSPEAGAMAGGTFGARGTGGGQTAEQERGHAASGPAQQGGRAEDSAQASAAATGAPAAPSSGVLKAARTGGGASEETRFQEAAATGIEVESRGSGQPGGTATRQGAPAASTAGQATGGAMAGQSGAGGASSQAAPGVGAGGAMAGGGAARDATAGRMSAGGAGSGAAATAPADSVPGDGGYDCPTGYPVKGNASSHIYHQPGTRSYEQTKPEFCFKTAAAAEAAGYRMSKQTLEAAGRPDLDVSEGLTGIGQSTGGAAGTKSVPADGAGVAASAATPGHAAQGPATQRSGANGETSHGGAGGAQAMRAPAGAVAGDGTHRCPNGYPIKGNASSRIYHVPGSSSYEQTIPEFCFDSSASAEAAGFRAPKR